MLNNEALTRRLRTLPGPGCSDAEVIEPIVSWVKETRIINYIYLTNINEDPEVRVVLDEDYTYLQLEVNRDPVELPDAIRARIASWLEAADPMRLFEIED